MNEWICKALPHILAETRRKKITLSFMYLIFRHLYQKPWWIYYSNIICARAAQLCVPNLLLLTSATGTRVLPVMFVGLCLCVGSPTANEAELWI